MRRYKHESQYLTEREEAHVRSQENEQQDSDSKGSSKESIEREDIPNMELNQETQGETWS